MKNKCKPRFVRGTATIHFIAPLVFADKGSLYAVQCRTTRSRVNFSVAISISELLRVPATDVKSRVQVHNSTGRKTCYY